MTLGAGGERRPITSAYVRSAVTSDWRMTTSRCVSLLSVGPFVVGSRCRLTAAGTLPQRVSGRRAPSSSSAMAVAAVGLPRAVRCPLLLPLSFLLVAGPALCWNDPGECLPAGAHPLRRHPLLTTFLLSFLSWLLCFSSRSGRGARIRSEKFPQVPGLPDCPLFLYCRPQSWSPDD